jgi:glycosyltransferase involved in cell wall biosynthesis
MALHKRAVAEGWRQLALNFSSRWRVDRNFSDLRAWIALVREHKIDLLHCHRGADHWCGVWVARICGIPLVRTRHVMTPVQHNPINRWLYLRATAAVLSVSRAVQAGFGSWVPLLPHGQVIYSAVKVDQFGPRQRSDSWRRRHAAPGFALPDDPEPLWFGLVGRFQNIKGQQYFMAAAALVAQQLPAAHFVMAGAGGSERIDKWQRRFAGPQGFADRVLVLDLVPDLPQLLASLDVGVIASIGSEGSSRIALEMMASGVPLVATRVGGLPELLAPLAEATLVPPADPSALAAAMLAWAADPDRRRRAGEQARAHVRAQHQPQRWINQIVDVYLDVLQARKKTEPPRVSR